MRRAPSTPACLLLLLGLIASGCTKPVHPGDPISGLTREQLDRFRRGRAVFDTVFTPERGLGPLFNAAACYRLLPLNPVNLRKIFLDGLDDGR